MPLLSFSHVTLQYDNNTVLDDFSLEIGKGEKVVIWGKSGIGKSSLFNLILGFVSPQNGQILFKNTPISDQTIWQVRKEIAYVAQDVMIGKKTIAQIITEVFALQSNSRIQFSQQKLDQLLTEFDLPLQIINKTTDEISGGEKQRLTIILAVLLKRTTFLLDEATAALDPQTKTHVIDFFLRHKEWTVVAISHDEVWKKHKNIKIFDMKEKQWIQ